MRAGGEAWVVVEEGSVFVMADRGKGGGVIEGTLLLATKSQ